MNMKEIEDIAKNIFQGNLVKVEWVDDNFGTFVLNTNIIQNYELEEFSETVQLDSIQVEKGNLIICVYLKV